MYNDVYRCMYIECRNNALLLYIHGITPCARTTKIYQIYQGIPRQWILLGQPYIFEAAMGKDLPTDAEQPEGLAWKPRGGVAESCAVCPKMEHPKFHFTIIHNHLIPHVWINPNIFIPGNDGFCISGGEVTWLVPGCILCHEDGKPDRFAGLDPIRADGVEAQLVAQCRVVGLSTEIEPWKKHRIGVGLYNIPNFISINMNTQCLRLSQVCVLCSLLIRAHQAPIKRAKEHWQEARANGEVTWDVTTVGDVAPGAT